MHSLSALALLAIGAAPAPAPAPGATVKAYSVSVVRPPKGFFPGVVNPAALSVGFAAELPGRSIIGLDPGACKVTLTDDKGTDLATPGRPVIGFPSVRTDPKRTQASFSVFGTALPAEGATKVRLKGTLVFLCGTGEKTSTAEGLALKPKEKVTAGPATFEVAETGKTLFVRVAADPLVKTIMLLDDKRLVGQIVPYLVVDDKGKITQKGQNVAPFNTPVIHVSVLYYEKLERVNVEVDTEIGIGG